jgi:hypothetical protein
VVTVSEWHVDAGAWEAYGAGRLGDIAMASIDAHVALCDVCQRSARVAVTLAETDLVWAGIRKEIRRPELPMAVRLLRRVGVPEADLAVLGASGGLVLPWSLAVGAALVCALLTSVITVRQDEIFWLLTPTATLCAVITAFEATELLRAIMGATSYDKVRLALLRTVATLAVAIPSTVAVGFAVPGLSDLAFVWLLPALALTALALALHTWLSSWTAAGLCGVGWLAIVLTLSRTGSFELLSGPGVQAACLAIAIAMAAVFAVRSSSFRLWGGQG